MTFFSTSVKNFNYLLKYVSALQKFNSKIDRFYCKKKKYYLAVTLLQSACILLT